MDELVYKHYLQYDEPGVAVNSTPLTLKAPPIDEKLVVPERTGAYEEVTPVFTICA